MSDTDNVTQTTAVMQPPEITQPAPLPAQLSGTIHTYNSQELIDFIDSVFHTPLAGYAHRLMYKSSTGNPGFPSTVSVLKKEVTRSKHGKALYFNTCTCIPDNTGRLRHKKELFSAMHVLVLDDIGTKIPLADVPVTMPPSYVIETSKGNFQYGYVLTTPITNVDHAGALVQIAAIAGLTDGGGVMATKIVRLPGGINGKAGNKHDFNVRLIHNTGPTWAPDALVDRMKCAINNMPVTWGAVINGFSPLGAKHHSKFLTKQPLAQNADGSVDPVLEWLYEENMVSADGGGEWVHITCPWCDSHSDGNSDAGYVPLGRGEKPNMRGYKCFHEHCKDRNTVDFLRFVMANSPFKALAVQYDTQLCYSEFAFDPAADVVWCIPEGKSWRISGFRNMYNDVIWVYEQGKKNARKTTAAQDWLESPYRLRVHGSFHSPGAPQVFERKGKLWVNPYVPMNWSPGIPDMKRVKPFLDFVEYLIPQDKERAYVLQTLAAKIQNPRFRGTALLMQTPSFGTGRGTFYQMLNILFQGHTAGIEFDQLIQSGGFNAWETCALVLVSEAREATSTMDSKGAYKAYEVLKQRVDTSVGVGTINEKFQPASQADICTSFIISTNHLDAIAIPPGDRRITVITNPSTPAPQAFFTAIYKWLEPQDGLAEKDNWAWHVVNWFRAQVVHTDALMLPLSTDAKKYMAEQSATPAEQVCHFMSQYMDATSCCAVSSTAFHSAIEHIVAIHDPQLSYTRTYLRKCANAVTIPLKISVRLTTASKKSPPTRLRMHQKSCTRHGLTLPLDYALRTADSGKFTTETKNAFIQAASALDVDAMIKYVLANME